MKLWKSSGFFGLLFVWFFFFCAAGVTPTSSQTTEYSCYNQCSWMFGDGPFGASSLLCREDSSRLSHTGWTVLAVGCFFLVELCTTLRVLRYLSPRLQQWLLLREFSLYIVKTKIMLWEGPLSYLIPWMWLNNESRQYFTGRGLFTLSQATTQIFSRWKCIMQTFSSYSFSSNHIFTSYILRLHRLKQQPCPMALPNRDDNQQCCLTCYS